MDAEIIAKLAYYDKPPDSALPHEWLLWYRLRDIYDLVRRGAMTKEMGRRAKQTAINSFESERAQWEQNVLLWKRVEPAAKAYAASDERTAVGDALYEALYRQQPSGGTT